MIEILFLFFLLMIIGNVLWYSWRFGITPTPTSRKVGKSIIDILPFIKEDQRIYELGSGWGTMSFALATHYPQCEIYAFEISPIPYFFSKLLNGRKNILYARKDFLSVPLRQASLIFCYLYPGAMESLKEKLQNELQAGTWIITHTFAIRGWIPNKIFHANDLYNTPIYIYLIK